MTRLTTVDIDAYLDVGVRPVDSLVLESPQRPTNISSKSGVLVPVLLDERVELLTGLEGSLRAIIKSDNLG